MRYLFFRPGLCLFVLVHVFLISPLFAQIQLPEIGLPHIENFTTDMYGGSPQTWQIIQTPAGTMFCGNTGGIFEYDGKTWRRHKPTHYPAGYALAADTLGNIFVGSFNELGLLRPDEKGKLTFQSLLARLPKNQRQFGAILKVHNLPDAVYFTSKKQILKLTGIGAADTTLSVVKADTEFSPFTFNINEQLLVPQRDIGIQYLRGGQLETIPGLEGFSANKIYDLIPLPVNFANPGMHSKLKLLLLHKNKGFFVYSNNAVKRWRTAIDRLLESSVPTSLLALPDGTLAVGTYKSGLLILDAQGDLLQLFDRSTGLLSDAIHSITLDREGSLWVGSGDGYSRIEMSNPVRHFDSRHGLNDIPLRVQRFEETLYVTTNHGVHYLGTDQQQSGSENPASGVVRPHFNFLAGSPSTQMWTFADMGEVLLVGSNHTLYAISNRQAHAILDYPAYALCRSGKDASRVWVGGDKGVRAIRMPASRKKDELLLRDRWVDEGLLPGLDINVESIHETTNGDLWVVPREQNRIMHVEFDHQSTDVATAMITTYDSSNGLPEATNFTASLLQGQIVVAANDRPYKFDAAENRFEIDTQLFARTDGQFNGGEISEDKFGNLWIASAGPSRTPGVFYQQEQRWHLKANINRKAKYPAYLNPDKDGTMWITGGESLIQYPTGYHQHDQSPFKTLLRRVKVLSSDTLFDGYSSGITSSVKYQQELDYEQNALRFEFAASGYLSNSKTEFRYKLSGFDERWSNWTSETRKDYTNLPEGIYTFRVHSRHIDGRTGEEHRFQFSILPPWYRSWWAYLLYAMALGSLLIFIVSWRSQQLVREKQALERLVADRTLEINSQAEKLREMDKLKSRFFANISHEFRTPLTLILGPLQDMIHGALPKDPVPQFKIMKENGNRLLRLVNQLLDLSRLESDTAPLQASEQDFLPFIRSIVDNFNQAAKARNIELSLVSPERSVMLIYNREALEKIFYNLLSNALKFTEPGGSVRIEVKQIADETGPVENSSVPGTRSMLEISVLDNGSGIPASQLPYVFDRFYQAANIPGEGSEATWQYGGSGIGLAITRELVLRHGGEIRVESEAGAGSTFLVRLPLGRDHLWYNRIQLIEPCPVVPTATTEAYEASPRKADLQQTPQSPERPLVLIVEDHGDVRQYIARQLSSEYDILEAADGNTGRDLAFQHLPDLIISDIMMPGLDGFELCRQLKNNIKSSHIPIILLTARAEDVDRIAGLEIGADDYLNKPFNSEELKIRVNNLIDLRRKLQEKLRRDLQLEPAKFELPSLDEQFLAAAKDCVEQKMDRFDFNATALANELSMSRMQLYRKLQSLVGLSASHYIRTIRLNRARQLLEESNATVTEISYAVGFNELAYFSKCFKAQFGKTPSDILKSKPTKTHG